VSESSNDQRLEPGGIKLNSAVIINHQNQAIDVSQLVIQLMLYENMFAPFITGELQISDAAALTELLPFIGEEMLVLDIETPFPGDSPPELFKRKAAFMIYKMSGRENVTQKNVTYTLHFASIEAFTDVNSKISQTFKGKISDTVRKLIKAKPGLFSKKEVAIEPTANAEIHTSNFWSPTQNIFYLTSRAVNAKNNPTYTFFENNEGFVFGSLDGLINAPKLQTFTKDQKTRQGNEAQSLEEEYGKVLDMSTPDYFDYFTRVQNGFYGSSLYHYDIQSKRLNFINRTDKDNWEGKHARLNPHTPYGKELQFLPEAALKTQVIHLNLFNNSPNLNVEHIPKRTALLAQVEAFKTNIRVYGRLDYTVGRVISLICYTDTAISKSDTDEKIVDEMLSGNYLITAMSHEITREAHYCNLELCKDSFIQDLSKS
jgi:hypothetical protein